MISHASFLLRCGTQCGQQKVIRVDGSALTSGRGLSKRNSHKENHPAYLQQQILGYYEANRGT